MLKTLVIALSALISAMFTVRAESAQEPEPVRASVVTQTTPSTTSSTTSTLPMVQISTTSTSTTTTTLPEGKCAEWFSLAVEVGWSIDRLETLGRIMWAESRCQPDVSGTGALGLTQVQYNAHQHWLRTEFGVTNRDELYDPALNLKTALWLAAYAEEHYGCWAQPWYMSGDWC